MAREWNLTSQQKKVAEKIAIGDPETFAALPKTQICEETGVSRSTLYTWLKNDEFTGFIEYVSDIYIRSKIPDVDKKLIDAVLNGKANSRLIETFYKRTAKLRENVKLDATVEGNKSMSEKSNEDLAKEIATLRREAGLDT